MAVIQYEVCDRCRERINDRSRLLSRVTRPKVYKFRNIVCGVTHERSMELCGDCSDELDKFLYPDK